MKRSKPRSAGSQIQRMSVRWPRLELHRSGSGALIWTGPVRGFQREHELQIQWSERGGSPPVVFVLNPKLKPRDGGRFADIPHLIFNEEVPVNSALCLFDPETHEWNSTMLIADTTVPWASEWLHYYELWHFDGVWRGSNAPGPISAGEMMAPKAGGEHGTGG